MGFTLIKKVKDNIYEKFVKNKSPQGPSLSEMEKLTIEKVENARSNFKDADEDSIDLAIYELMAAEERLNLLIKDKKKKQ